MKTIAVTTSNSRMRQGAKLGLMMLNLVLKSHICRVQTCALSYKVLHALRLKTQIEVYNLQAKSR